MHIRICSFYRNDLQLFKLRPEGMGLLSVVLNAIRLIYNDPITAFFLLT